MTYIKKSITWSNFIKRSKKALPKKEERFKKKAEKFGGLDIQRRHSLYKLQLSARTTEAEELFGYILCWCEIPFYPQKGFFEPFHIICDFFLPQYNVAIEIDGRYHDSIKEKDAYRDKIFLEKRGVRTYRFTNEQVFAHDQKIFELLFRFNRTPEGFPEVLRVRADRLKKIKVGYRKSSQNKSYPRNFKSKPVSKVFK